MRSIRALALGCALAAGRAQAEPPPQLTAQDFAAGLELTPEPGLALQTLLVPLEVARGARGDLSDLTVFDADGRPVAWAVRALVPGHERQLAERDVPCFPVRGSAQGEAGRLALRVQRGAGGTIVNVAAAEDAQGERLFAYIVHTGASERELTSVCFTLSGEVADQLVPLRIEASDDLARWQTLADGAVIGRLALGPERIERTCAELPPIRATFLRLSWPGELPFEIASARVREASVRASDARAPVRLLVGPVTPDKGAYLLDLGATLPLLSLAPRFPEENIVLQAELFAGEPNALERVFGGQLYHLTHEGSTLSSAPIALGGARARFLRLRVEAQAAQLAREPLSFELSYAPDQLLFVPRGTKPHLLAFGSHRAGRAPFSATQLTEFLTPAQLASLPLETVKRGAFRKLAGPSARLPPKPPRSQRKLVLWGVLIAGAAGLLALALRLLHKTRGA